MRGRRWRDTGASARLVLLAALSCCVLAACPSRDEPSGTRVIWSQSEREQACDLTARFAAEPASGDGEERAAPLVGSRLPQTRFLTAEGDVVDLERAPRRSRLLVVLRGDPRGVCLYCASQTLALNDAASQFDARRAEVLLVYPGAVERAPEFMSAVHDLRADGVDLAHPVLLDVDLRLVRALDIAGNLARPTSLVLDEDLTIRYAYAGRDFADRPSVEELLHAIDGLP